VRLNSLESGSKSCSQTLRHIENVIRDLENARADGVWFNRDKLWFGLRTEPKFIGKGLGRILRGEKIQVREVKGDWLRVRNSSGVEGWVQKGEMLPGLPVELSSKAGTGPGSTEVLDKGGRG
jgi:hypothetical protein